jgi:epoxyqueuosine reductase QueG
MNCVTSCPVGAITADDYPSGIIRKDLCARYSKKLLSQFISPCGICIKVCQVGKDRIHFGREDISIYKNFEKYPEYHNAWEHVQQYGGKNPK